ncbi:MAG: hypothetical protein Q8R67_06235 [Rhodoferax sp.]|nr:hypothetical protein [Rhodoferax sp.]MDP3651263.1 hypothetical protein [Rhodoferax sp.]
MPFSRGLIFLRSGLAGRLGLLILDVVVVGLCAALVASLLGFQFLVSGNLPTGGDTASHLLYAWVYAHELLPKGHITAWMPEVFAGLPFLSYYFPLPFISIAALAGILPFAPAMKLGMFAAAMLLSGAVWLGSVYWLKLPRVVAIWGVLASLAFLLQEQNSIWGGNLLSTLAGEFAYSYGVIFAVVALFAWQRAIATGRYWWLPALLEAATGFSHGFALLITGFATTAFLLDGRNFLRNLRLLTLGHSFAFFLLAGWLWPMLEMHGITIPNDALFEVQNWQDLLPRSVLPIFATGLVAALFMGLMQVIPALRRLVPATLEVDRSVRHAGFMACSALLAAIGFLAGGKIGLANIRFFPFVWLLGGIACAWLWGSLLLRVSGAFLPVSRWGLALLGAACAVSFAGWMSLHVVAAPDWGLWNHSGLESKPQWNLLSRLFPALSGNLASPRLLFEHDPANSDIGSTRALEALPMFLGSRPVLEGLYMESALLSPATYQLQSEVSAHPSSPLARFPSGSMDLATAGVHMNFLYSNEVLVRNEDTRRLFAASGAFDEVAKAPPFHVFRLKGFNTQMVDLVDRPLRWLPTKGWMEESFRWFRSSQRFLNELPVFSDGAEHAMVSPSVSGRIHDLKVERHSIRWRTDAVGAAHLVRMAWHPRWHLVSKGSLHLAGPGFMLVIPEEADVELEYGHTSIGAVGMVATLLSLLALGALVWRDFRSVTVAAEPGNPWPRDGWALLWPIFLIALGIWLHLHNPERLYTQAWELMRAGNHAKAADEFDQAFAARKGDAKKEEALFWSAKANEQAGRTEAALTRYRELTAHFYGFWLPESLFAQAQLAQAAGATAESKLVRERLLQEFPNDRWAKRVAQGGNP